MDFGLIFFYISGFLFIGIPVLFVLLGFICFFIINPYEKYKSKTYKADREKYRFYNQNQSQQKQNNKTQERSKEEEPPESIFGFKVGESYTKAELRKRYFELMKKYHPDNFASSSQEFIDLANKKSKKINEAYEKLK